MRQTLMSPTSFLKDTREGGLEHVQPECTAQLLLFPLCSSKAANNIIFGTSKSFLGRCEELRTTREM